MHNALRAMVKSGNSPIHIKTPTPTANAVRKTLFEKLPFSYSMEHTIEIINTATIPITCWIMLENETMSKFNHLL